MAKSRFLKSLGMLSPKEVFLPFILLMISVISVIATYRKQFQSGLKENTPADLSGSSRLSS